jgi:hypothetical protein
MIMPYSFIIYNCQQNIGFFVTGDSNTDEQLLRRSFQLYIADEQIK